VGDALARQAGRVADGSVDLAICWVRTVDLVEYDLEAWLITEEFARHTGASVVRIDGVESPARPSSITYAGSAARSRSRHRLVAGR
jgi:hypothetical protein